MYVRGKQMQKTLHMKEAILVIVILLSTMRTFAQDTILIYMNEDYEIVHQIDSAKYIRKAIINDTKYYITDKYIDGIVYSYYELSSVNPKVFDGLSIDYNKNNDYYSKGYYRNDKMIGSWLYYDEFGNIDSVYYNELKASKIKRAQYHRSSKKTKQLGYQVIDSLNSFLRNNFHLPPRARDGRESFQVLINCTIGKKGHVLWHEIAYPNVHKDIAHEINRLLGIFQYNHQAGKALEISVALTYGIQPDFDENTAFMIVEDMPVFQSKEYDSSFNRFVEANISDDFRNCSGTAYVSFIVEKDGSLSLIEIRKEIENCPGYREEIERILKSSPKWQPGKQRDKPVRVKGCIFITFGKNK